MSNKIPAATDTSIKARIQRVGGHMAGMVMPNIGAFIAWGLITALFIPKGWIPNETMAALVDPMVKMLLPLLIAYTGGRMVHGHRGGVIGAVATVGIVVGADVPMFLGAMIMGPLAAYLMKLIDKPLESRIKPGFEMLVNNFSAGILGAGLAMLGLWGIGPVISKVTVFLGDQVKWLVEHNLLPLASLIVEPAKVLFLNNAINHGAFTPLGTVESKETGQSILFMIESNPGPGLGLLLAFLFFGPRKLRGSTPAAIAIQFLGGIHEIYFPYVLMKPRLILAVMAGGVTGVATFMITGVGLTSAPAPGSIFAFWLTSPPGNLVGMMTGVVLAAAASFAVAGLLLGFGRKADPADEAVAAVETAPTADTGAAVAIPAPATSPETDADRTEIAAELRVEDISKIVVACDAGMGSSVMLASQLRKQLKDHDVTVEHTPVDAIPADADVIICHEGLAERARSTAPGKPVIPIQVFLGDPAVTSLIATIKKGGVLNV
ncbi:PTS mannitol transporter subunit IICB [Stackebrandtia nassauensis]|uniref:PTS system mannitol-specific EIICB component n=1 Tax=Stackebrandtia nassauensis (strain DSM 44728 / CIP 108903 / NRRL B-16338 / NBRC 102104 / LLR-40K-21) TaxID=446470 RepID=D3Q1X0_STANL|nr:PTS mannitol transporter subunit IICB [Stackebrandtia nassauensis]ADD41837.1 PTS system, mannitol-specific IIC subunit [Stackebrandtia nassauensis DSM 44728]